MNWKIDCIRMRIPMEEYHESPWQEIARILINFFPNRYCSGLQPQRKTGPWLKWARTNPCSYNCSENDPRRNVLLARLFLCHPWNCHIAGNDVIHGRSISFVCWIGLQTIVQIEWDPVHLPCEWDSQFMVRVRDTEAKKTFIVDVPPITPDLNWVRRK